MKRNRLTDLANVLETDVLVIGGGIAACMAAVEAREKNVAVTLVDKAQVGRSGVSPMMSGVLELFDPDEDDYDDWLKRLFEIGEYLNEQDVLGQVIGETTNVIRELQSWGVEFKKRNGKIERYYSVGGHMKVKMVHGGIQLMNVVRGEVIRGRVRVEERVMVTGLLTSDGESPTRGRVVGAIGFNIRTGKICMIKAKATIVCSGAVALQRLHGAPPFLLNGDGIMAAFNVGCQLKNLELTLASCSPSDFNLAPGANLMLGQGGYLINAGGERFMERYDSVQMERAPKPVVGIAVAKEYLAGRGPVFQDLRHLDSKAHDAIRIGIPIYVKAVERAGLDLTRDLIRYKSSSTPCMAAGGIRINRERATTIPGLYAAGSSADHAEDGAANGLGNGMDSAVAGKIAGRCAAQFALEIEPQVLNEDQAELLAAELFGPLKRDTGIVAQSISEDVSRIWDSIQAVRSEKGLEEAIDKVKEIESEKVPKLRAEDYHTLSGTLGVINKVSFLGLFCKFALMRTESRGGHFRIDYPERDDKNWLRWIICQQMGDGVKVWSEPIPFEKYPLKPPSWQG